jgi:predicted lipid carrier protein YhbT
MSASQRAALYFSRAVAYGKRRGMHSPRGPVRKVLLTSVFRAMPGQIDRQRAKGVDAVVEWRVLNHKGVADSIWTTAIADGRCVVTRGAAVDPRTTIELTTGDFLLLAAGQASGPTLLFSGRLKLSGDLMLAAGLASMFTPPPG